MESTETSDLIRKDLPPLQKRQQISSKMDTDEQHLTKDGDNITFSDTCMGNKAPLDSCNISKIVTKHSNSIDKLKNGDTINDVQKNVNIDKNGTTDSEGCEECKDITPEDFDFKYKEDLTTACDCESLQSEKPKIEQSNSKNNTNSSITSISTNGTLSNAQQQDSPDIIPCVLRHRLDPEPPSSKPVSNNGTTEDEDPQPKSSKDVRKLAQIQKALDSNPVDIDALRKLAISSGGLLNKHMRRQVWPLLINVNDRGIPLKPSKEEMEAMEKTYNQVVMDVNRSSSRFPPGIDDFVRMSMKDKLVDLIMRVMLYHKGQLKYYQGFHDVCVTFLLCMDEDMSFAMVNKLAMGYMREYLDETMERTSLLLNYIYPLINKCNPELCQHMQRNDLGTIFALSWVITWFSHTLGDIRRILRVFDFFLASHRMMPVYLSAAFVLHREADIFEAGDEMGYIHKCLTVMPSDLPIESLLERAGDLYLQYPPSEMSSDPMLLQLNSEVYEHFNLIEKREAVRRERQQMSRGGSRGDNNLRSRLFVRATMWTITAVVGVAAVVVYHTYSTQDWGAWSPFS